MRGLSVLCLILAGCGPTLTVGYARPGYVVRVEEKSGKVLSRRNYDGVIDGMYGFCPGPRGTLFVSSYRTGTVLQYARENLRRVVAQGLPGPTAILMRRNGELLVACSGSTAYLLDRTFEGQGRLVRVPLEGEPEPLPQSEHLAIPTALVAGPDGTIYIGQRNSNKILRLAGDGSLEVVAELDLAGGPMHLAFDAGGKLHAASALDSRVVQVDPVHTVVDDEFLGQPGGIAFGSKGELYVTSHQRGEIRVYDPSSGRLVRLLAENLAAPWTIR